MRKSTLFFVWTVSLLMGLCLTFTACGSSSLSSSTGTAPSRTRQLVNQVYALAWSPDRRRLASGGQDQVVHVWNLTTDQPVFAYRSRFSTGEVLTLAWSPDGKYLASGSRDHTVQVWDAMTGKRLVTYRGHAAEVWEVSWSPDGEYLASVGDGGVVQLWNATTGKQVWLLHL